MANQGCYAPDMTERTPFDALMHEVCVVRGWCGAVVDNRPTHVTDFLPHNGNVTADQFVDWLFKADGVDPDEDREKWQGHIDGLRDAFVLHMSGFSVDVQQLVSDGS